MHRRTNRTAFLIPEGCGSFGVLVSGVLLATGLDNAKIADVMGISVTTVRNHIDHVLTKLGVHSKLEAVVFAARHEIV